MITTIEPKGSVVITKVSHQTLRCSITWMGSSPGAYPIGQTNGSLGQPWISVQLVLRGRAGWRRKKLAQNRRTSLSRRKTKGNRRQGFTATVFSEVATYLANGCYSLRWRGDIPTNGATNHGRVGVGRVRVRSGFMTTET